MITAQPKVEPQNYNGTEMKISKLKNGEISEHDHITAEFINSYINLFLRYRRKRKYQINLKYDLINLIHKKGD